MYEGLKSNVMHRKNNPKENPKESEDSRALWERPAFRRLVTRYAEGLGPLPSEGIVCGGSGASLSCKNFPN